MDVPLECHKYPNKDFFSVYSSTLTKKMFWYLFDWWLILGSMYRTYSLRGPIRNSVDVYLRGNISSYEFLLNFFDLTWELQLFVRIKHSAAFDIFFFRNCLKGTVNMIEAADSQISYFIKVTSRLYVPANQRRFAFTCHIKPLATNQIPS